MPEILIVDDNVGTCENIQEIFEGYGFSTRTCGDGASALQIIKKGHTDCVILDMQLPVLNGWQVLEQIRDEIETGLIVIAITAYGQVSTAVQAMRSGAYDFIEKPFNNDLLVMTVNRALNNSQIKQELRDLQQSVVKSHSAEYIFGTSKAIQQSIIQADRIAPTNLTVLIQGETGTGKGVMARYIHDHSERKDYPLITVNCGSIPENLIESEMFGYEGGAFTSARPGGQIGWFQSADKGTLFLDEIGTLLPRHQASLLRIIEAKEVTPIGSAKAEIAVNPRIIVATNEDLAKLVKTGHFRRDLYYRLNMFEIRMPLLRERREDIPHLCQQFITLSNIEMRKNIRGTTQAALRLLLKYDWPGNVRELEHTIKKAMLLTNDWIRPGDLSFMAEQPEPSALLDFVDYIAGQGHSYYRSLHQNIEKIESELICKALREADGVVSRAAEIMGIGRKTFYRKAEKFNLFIDEFK